MSIFITSYRVTPKGWETCPYRFDDQWSVEVTCRGNLWYLFSFEGGPYRKPLADEPFESQHEAITTAQMLANTRTGRRGKTFDEAWKYEASLQ